MLRALLLLVAWALPATAEEEVLAGLSQSRISITADFDGTELLIFGTVKRDAPGDPEAMTGIVVTVSGPAQKVTVRRKERFAGIWINRAAVEVDRAPSFYAIATSAPIRDILSWTEDLRHAVSIPRAIRSVGAPSEVQDSEAFTEALVRIRTGNDLYQDRDSTVELVQDTLFSTSVVLPANLVEGNYTVRILLTRDRQVVTSFDTVIFVQKVGLERFLYTLAHEQPLFYGLLSLLLAVAAGWGASEAFRYIRS
nr:TIGR02186 family protein [Kandeliimicrobium roseum]